MVRPITALKYFLISLHVSRCRAVAKAPLPVKICFPIILYFTFSARPIYNNINCYTSNHRYFNLFPIRCFFPSKIFFFVVCIYSRRNTAIITHANAIVLPRLSRFLFGGFFFINFLLSSIRVTQLDIPTI